MIRRLNMGSRPKVIRRLSQIWMNEGRKCQILLPDERRLDILIQPKLLTSDLLDIVASHFKLKEKDYFGLAFQDETGHYNWLQLEKKVLEHDLPRKQSSNLVIAFLVRFYVESITQLRDTATVELFYLTAKQAVFKGQIECDSETVFELASHVLQATLGDYADDATTKADLKKLPLITTSALREHPSIQFCEERVIHYYQKIAGTAKGLAIVNYMTILESLPTYGIHYFEVKDKKDIPWWLGISNKGIGVYDKNDKNVPRRVFVWKTLENLYYRDKKFSIEVHDPKRVSVSRRTFGPGNVNVHAWFGATPQLTKCIWSMAVAQHQFYHERKNSRATLPSVRSVSELATELSRSTSSLPGSIGSDISRSGSSASLPSLGASRFDLNFDPADTAKVQREMFSALKARREALEEILRKRTEELKLLCIKEGELTGCLPEETPLAPGEEPPQIRRRVGTAFSLDADIVPAGSEDDDTTKKLELELELQKQITNAAHKLASDKSVSRFVRKQRRHSFIKAQTKLKEMEKKIGDHRKGSVPNSPGSSSKYDDSEAASPAQSPLVPRGPRSNYKQHDGRPGQKDSPMHRSHTAPKDFSGEREIASMTLTPTNSSPSLEAGYKPNSVYSTQYRNQTYPTLGSRSQSQISNNSDYDNKGGNQGRLEGSQDSGFSSTNNMYNVNSRRTSRYESNQDLISPSSESHYETLDNMTDSKLNLQGGSLDNAHRKPHKNYGSLERNLKKRHNHQYERKHSDSDASVDSSNAPSKFGKRTSRSEYDLSSKGKDPVPSALKEMDILLPNRGYTSSGQTSSHNRADRYNSDRHRTEITLGSERYNSSDRKNSEMTPGSDRHYTSDRIKTEMTQGSDRYNTSDRNRSEVTPGSDRYSDTRSRNELTPGSSRGMIELQVTHEGGTTGTPQGYRPDRDRKPEVYIQSQTVWNDTASAEPSPIIQSPTKKTFNEPFSVTISGGTGDSTQGQCYSPREYEGSRGHSHARPQYTEHSVSAKHVESPHTVPQAMSSKIVTVGKMSPHVEVSKPFEMKDFYKYSEKLRRQRLVEQYHQALVGSSRSSTPSQHSSDGENHSTPSYHHSGSHGVPGTPSSGTYRGSNSSSPFGSPLSSRHMPSNNLYNSHSHSKGDHTNYGNSRTNSVSSSVTYGVNTTTSRVQYTVQSQTGRVVYKAQHQSSRQTYQPPTSMKCEPVRSMRDVHGASQETPTSSRPPKSGHHHQRQYSTPEKMLSPMNMSFNLPSPGSLSRAFSNEMLEWYDGDSNQSPTSV